MRLSAMLLLVCALLGFVGCRGTDSPVAAYTAFHTHVRKQDYKKAYAALSQPTRDVIDAQAQKLKEASGGSLKAEPYELFFVNSATPADVTEVTVVREEGDAATVRVLSSGQAREVRMVREASGWKIDLSDSLKQ
ncbi:hypothetical protein [Hyalangium rubrum]|uniref:DUF4878 domain-containing protein n=1 Tax=Hyalangium rubrum TaxID=3103134 RepID=A0ABU5H8M6_9BACT|nr:hypothetical protein [Hyalangium sp. s54d21]MDY7228445.1 hypothetical protein [Hyalangium sp. s54d21]